ncbi:MAG TPA: hypothetical protein PKY81_08020 [bacterium]|nr:hypothetical protein [bacterium]HPN30889.1 hypothetical protein [bacterium]
MRKQNLIIFIAAIFFFGLNYSITNADEIIGKIKNINGTVEISFIEGIWLPCEDGKNSDIGLNVSIKTQKNASAELELKNGKIIKLIENTLFKSADIIKSEYLTPELVSQECREEGGSSEKKMVYKAIVKNIKKDKTAAFLTIYNEFGEILGEYKMNSENFDETNDRGEYEVSVTLTETGKYSHRYKFVCSE